MSSCSTKLISRSSCVNSGWRSARRSSSRIAARDLEVALEAGHHQQLLELLRRLRQRVEVAGVHAARHQVVARALRRRVGEDRRLDLDERRSVEELADEGDDAVAHEDVGVHPLAPQVEVAVLEAQLLVDVGVLVDVERRRLGGVEQFGGLGAHLDLAGGEVGVLGAGAAALDTAADAQHVLAASVAGDGVRGRLVGTEDDLHQAAAIAQVDEDEPAVVAPAVHPARERDLAALVACAQVAAIVGLVHVPLPASFVDVPQCSGQPPPAAEQRTGSGPARG